MKKYIYAFIAAVLAASGPLGAQELDPTVVVNRAYEGKLLEVHKPSFEMEIPDTVSKFDLDFDYSVFDKPYKGAYEFTPYVLTLRPASEAKDIRKLYLKAGAGYTLHPVLDFVWTPALKGAFNVDVYGMSRSYIGDYYGFAPVGDAASWSGYDVENRAGVDGSYDWRSGSMAFDVAYYGVALKDDRKSRMYNAVDVTFGLSSKARGESYFKYALQADYMFGQDELKSHDAQPKLGEHVYGVDASVGQVIRKKHDVSIDMDADFVTYSHPAYSATVGQFDIVPHYVLTGRRWSVDAGLRVSKLIRPDAYESMFPTKGQFLYPDVSAWYDVIPSAMRAYARMGGGNELNTYSSLLKRNHHFDMTYAAGMWPVMDATVERLSTSFGVEGRVGSKFAYDLRAGYVNYKNAPLEAVLVSPVDGQYLPGLGYDAYQKLYAGADVGLKLDSFEFDGNVEYTHAWGVDEASGLLAPAALTGNVAFEYNWNRRIFAGMDCEFASRRNVVAGYADLGLNLEFAATRALAFWFRGGNLLNMAIQRNPLYAEKGVNFTLGICLNL